MIHFKRLFTGLAVIAGLVAFFTALLMGAAYLGSGVLFTPLILFMSYMTGWAIWVFIEDDRKYK